MQEIQRGMTIGSAFAQSKGLGDNHVHGALLLQDLGKEMTLEKSHRIFYASHARTRGSAACSSDVGSWSSVCSSTLITP